MLRTHRTRGTALTIAIVLTLVIGALAMVLRNAGAPNVAALKKNGGGSTLSFSAHPTVTAPSEPENILGNSPQVAYGVDFPTGQFRYVARGLHFAGISGHGDRDMSLRLDLIYRSHGSTNGYFGRNWHFRYFQWVEERTVGQDTVLDYYDGTGRVDTFSSYNASTHKWDTNPSGYFGAFVESTDSGYDWDRYTYTDVNGFKRTFDDDGRLYRMTDRNGNYIQAIWGSGSTKFKLTELRDTTYDGSSRVIQLSYYSTNRVQAFTDYGNGVATRTTTLLYNGNDELEKFETPKPSSGASTTPYEFFVYDTNHNLTQIKHPLSGGTTWLTNTYDTNTPPRVSEQNWGGETFQICYLSSPTRMAIVDGNARLVEYHVPASAPTNVPSKKVEHTGAWAANDNPCTYAMSQGSKVRSSDPDNYTTEYTWTSHGQLANVKYPRGNATVYARNDSSRPWAVTSVIRKEHDSDADSDDDNVVTTYTYAGNYGQVKTIQEPKGSGYTTTFYYDFEEDATHDYNEDGVYNETKGNLVKLSYPNVSVPVTQNDNYETFTHNSRGQIVNHLRNRSDGTIGQITTRNAYYTTTGSGALKDFVQSVTENYGGSDTIVTTYEYNSVGLVTAIVDPRNTSWKTLFAYDNRDRMKERTSPLGTNYTEKHFFNDWDLKTETEVKNVTSSGVVTANPEWTTKWTYNNNRRLPTKEEIEVSTDTYKATNFTYDGHFNRQDVEDPNGNKVRTLYDERNLIFKITRGYNAPSTLQSTVQYDYDGNRNRTKITDARNSTQLFEYDLFERMTKDTDELSNYRTHAYDQNGNRWQTKHKNAAGSVLARQETLVDQRNRPYAVKRFKSDSDTNYIATETRYDRDGNVIENRGPTCGGSCPDTERTYDAFNRVTKAEDRDGNYTEYFYDDSGNVTTIKEHEKDGSSTYTYETLQDFDAGSRMTSRTVKDKDDPTNSNKWRVTAYAYDSRNNLLQTTDPRGYSTTYTYDGRSAQLTKSIAAGTSSYEEETYVYDNAGRLDQRKDDNNKATKYEYDELNRMTAMHHNWVSGSAPADTTKYEYDKNDNLTKVFDPRGNQSTTYFITNIYDDANRLTSRAPSSHFPSSGNGKDIYGYTALGQLASAVARNNGDTADVAATSFEYDFLGRKVEENTTLFGGTTREYTFTYDDDGSRTQITYPNTNTVSFTRTANHMIDTVTSSIVTGTLVDLDYIGPRRIRTASYLSGASQQFGYNGFREINDIVHQWYGGGELHLSYARDKNGNPTSEHNETNSKWTLHTYNRDNRLGQSKLNCTNDQGAAANPTLTWAFSDDIGNLTTLTRAPSTGSPVVTYACNDGTNARTYWSTTSSTCPPSTPTHGYDLAGNMTSEPSKTYTYDYANRLIAFSGSSTWYYTYDALGRRVQKRKSDDTVIVRSYYDGNDILEQYVVASSTERLARRIGYADGIDRPLFMMWDSSTPPNGAIDKMCSYFHWDQLGSPIRITDEDGNLEEQYAYEPYGTVEITDGSGGSLSASAIENPFGLAGRERDDENTLYHYRARAYHPGMGRFMQRDPIHYANGMNQYEYIRSRPLYAVDPMGTDIRCTSQNFEGDQCPSLVFGCSAHFSTFTPLLLAGLNLVVACSQVYNDCQSALRTKYNELMAECASFCEQSKCFPPLYFDTDNHSPCGQSPQDAGAIEFVDISIAAFAGRGPLVVSSNKQTPPRRSPQPRNPPKNKKGADLPQGKGTDPNLQYTVNDAKRTGHATLRSQWTWTCACEKDKPKPASLPDKSDPLANHNWLDPHWRDLLYNYMNTPTIRPAPDPQPGRTPGPGPTVGRNSWIPPWF